MWNLFPNDMGLNNSVELALANLDLNELVLDGDFQVLSSLSTGFVFDHRLNLSFNCYYKVFVVVLGQPTVQELLADLLRLHFQF
jgi:hypothetical protein